MRLAQEMTKKTRRMMRMSKFLTYNQSRNLLTQGFPASESTANLKAYYTAIYSVLASKCKIFRALCKRYTTKAEFVRLARSIQEERCACGEGEPRGAGRALHVDGRECSICIQRTLARCARTAYRRPPKCAEAHAPHPCAALLTSRHTQNPWPRAMTVHNTRVLTV